MNTDNHHAGETRVIVLGGGYAGTLAANRLQSAAQVAVTLVNPRPEFVERIRLHQLVAGNHRATRSYAEVLNPNVNLIVDAAERIEPAARRIRLGSGTTLDYDYLIYAIGSAGVLPPSVAQFAYLLSEFESAQRLRQRLAEVGPRAPLAIVGGGLTGIESAAEFAEHGRNVTLVCRQLAPSLAAPGRRSVARQLARLGVNVIEGATVTAVAADRITLTDGQMLPSAVTVWTTGFGVPGLAAASGLSTDALGRLRTDETLTSIDDPRIIAAGDCAAPSDRPLRMSCQSALPLGAQAAQTVLARIAGGAPAEISQAFAGQCISLGRRAGTVALVHADDRPRASYIGGRAGAVVKEQVCRMTVSFLRGEARRPGSYRWIKSGWRRALPAVGQPVSAQ
jgi:NADH dehydrogenase